VLPTELKIPATDVKVLPTEAKATERPPTPSPSGIVSRTAEAGSEAQGSPVTWIAAGGAAFAVLAIVVGVIIFLVCFRAKQAMSSSGLVEQDGLDPGQGTWDKEDETGHAYDNPLAETVIGGEQDE
jgi:hypothetical protein